MNYEKIIRNALNLRVIPLYKVPGTYYNNEWNSIDDNAEIPEEDRGIGDSYKNLYRNNFKSSALKEEFPINDLVIMPNGLIGKVIGFKGPNMRVVLNESGSKSYIIDSRKLKETCK